MRGASNTTEHPLATLQRTLPPELQSAGNARALVRTTLEESGRARWSDRAELAITEVVSNAILHAHTPIDVCIRVYPEHVHIEVGDHNTLLPAPRRYDNRATTGRGLGLVALLTRTYGIEAREEGKVVWFTIDDHENTPTWDAEEWENEHEWGDEIPHQHTPTPNVTLTNLPVPLWLAAQQHHEALLREHTLHQADEKGQVHAQIRAADQAETILAAAVQSALDTATAAGVPTEKLPAGHPSPLPETPRRLDVTLHLEIEQSTNFAALQDVLDQAEKSAHEGALLAKPALDEIINVRDWCCEQIIAQLQGVQATPWNEEEHPRNRAPRQDGSTTTSWDATHVQNSARGVVAADDRNRIVAVSAPLAAALGWEREELLGERIIALIPHRLRELHVAGFTRHLTTGEAHVIGVPLELPVLRADGAELTCSFMIEQVPSGTGSIYIAWIEPVQTTADSGERTPDEQ